MKDVETLIYARLIGDATFVGLIGGVGNIIHGFQNIPPKKPQITFWNLDARKGTFVTDVTNSDEIIYQFSTFANNYLDVCIRLKALFNDKQFDPLPGFEQADCMYSFWDGDVTETFDDDLKVKGKE